MTANGHKEKRVDARGTGAAGAIPITGVSATASDRQTWRDWQHPNAPDPDPLLTRDQFLQHLDAKGIAADERNLLYWQSQDVIPYAERRRIGRVGYAYYPAWMIDIVGALRDLQAEGAKLEEIRVRLRQLARTITAPGLAGTTGGVGGTSGSLTVTPATATARADATLTGERAVPATVSVAVTQVEFSVLAETIARTYEANSGPPITRVELRLYDERGNPHVFTYRTDAP